MQNRIRFFGGEGSRRSRQHDLSDQRKSIDLVKKCAKKLGLKLHHFLTNSKLELYFDIYKHNKNTCYVSKGWSDPGYRIGEIVAIDKTMRDFKERFYDLFRISSKNLISVGIVNSKSSDLCVSLEICIYQGGFNEKVLKEAIKTLELTVTEFLS